MSGEPSDLSAAAPEVSAAEWHGSPAGSPGLPVELDHVATRLPPSSAPERPPGPVRVLGDGLTVAAGSARLLRGASIYLGLLTLAIVGPAVVAELWVFSWAGSIEVGPSVGNAAALSAAERTGILLVVAVVGGLIVSIEGGAIGTMLVAGQAAGRPITLRVALERSRKVFWRLVRVALVVGLLELVATLLWRWFNGSSMTDAVGFVGVEPVPGAIASLPFVYTNVAIVVGDDAARAALRRSLSVSRRSWKLALALAAFALASGVIEGLALGSGFDVIVRVTNVLRLDVTAGGWSLLVAIVLALAIVTAFGSLIFTVAAVVSAPQVVAWMRLQQPLSALPPDPSEPDRGATSAPVEPGAPAAPAAPAAPDESVAMAAPLAAGDPGPADPDESAVPETEVGSLEPVTTDDASEATTPSVPDAVRSEWDRPQPFRWMTIPMRLTVIVVWTGVLILVLGGRPA